MAKSKTGVRKKLSAIIEEGGYCILDEDDPFIGADSTATYTIPDPEPKVDYVEVGYQDSSEDVVTAMRRKGYRSAKDAETLRHGTKYPHQSVQGHPVAVLGGHSRDHNVLILSRAGAKQRLERDRWDRSWEAYYRFAGVKIHPAPGS